MLSRYDEMAIDSAMALQQAAKAKGQLATVI